MATNSIRVVGWPVVRGRRQMAEDPALTGTPVPRGERILVTTRQSDGSPVLATKLALYHLSPTDPRPWVRLGWERVSRVDWIEPHGAVLTGWTPDTPVRTVLAVRRTDRLIGFVRERIAATTLLTTRIPLGDDGGGAWVAARRQPGDGDLLWMVVLDAGVHGDAAVRDEVDRTLSRLRRAIE